MDRKAHLPLHKKSQAEKPGIFCFKEFLSYFVSSHLKVSSPPHARPHLLHFVAVHLFAFHPTLSNLIQGQ
jgi:hypothetical protein